MQGKSRTLAGTFRAQAAYGMLRVGDECAMMQREKPNSMPIEPAIDYAAAFMQARAQVAALQAEENETINPVCATRLYDHGQRTRQVVVCYHGYTNCPFQFQSLAEHFYAQGKNVFVPRLPYHGIRDRMTSAQAHLTTAELIRFTNHTIDIAKGLGDEIILTGLSAGAIMAAWAAQFRTEVHTAVVAAPSLGLPGFPVWASDAISWLLHHMPNLFIWWDQKAKEKIEGAPHAYPRFATRSLGEIVELGWIVRRAAHTTPPQAKQLAILMSESDAAVHHGLIAQLAADWQRHVPDRVTFHRFPADLHIHHDMVDPTQPTQRVDIVYPVWNALVNNQSIPNKM